MRFVLDMNVTRDWIPYLERAGHEAVHWSSVGREDASDREIMAWAREQNRIVLTHGLDFGTWLAASGDEGPSVVQIRTEATLPNRIGDLVLHALALAEADLLSGALLTVEAGRPRIRSLPFRKDI